MHESAQTWIVLRLPGFAAAVERSVAPPGEDRRPIAVIDGEGDRALVHSLEPTAKRLGLWVGARLGDIAEPDRLRLLPARHPLYRHTQRELLRQIDASLPGAHLLRAGLFGARWSSGTRFLEAAFAPLRERIREMGYFGSWGIAPQQAVAEIAARVAERGDTLRVERGQLRSFLEPLPLSLLYDLGEVQLETLRELGVRSFGDIHSLPASLLRRLLGPDGAALRELALTGRRPDPAPAWRGRGRFPAGEADPARLRDTLALLVAEALGQLHDAGRQPGRMTLTLIYSDARAATGQPRIGAVKGEGRWQRAALDELMRIWRRRVSIAEIRLTLQHGPPCSRQLGLFTYSAQQERRLRLNSAVGELRRRWGSTVLHYGATRREPGSLKGPSS